MTGPALDHLRTFVTVVQAGSLTSGARLLGLGQATVSAHIQALERHLGEPLLVRERSGVRPTPRGIELARDAERHIEALETLVDTGDATVKGRRVLRVGGPAESLSLLVVPELASLVEKVGAPLRMRFGLADELVESLRNGLLDVVVSAGRPRARGIEATAFMDEEFVLVASPRWQDVARSGGLESVPLVAYGEDLPIVRRYWRTVFGRRPTGLDLAVVVPDLRAILDVVRTGGGMSVLPTYLVAPALESGELVALDRTDVPPLNTVFIVTRSGDVRRDPLVADLVARLRDLAPRTPD